MKIYPIAVAIFLAQSSLGHTSDALPVSLPDATQQGFTSEQDAMDAAAHAALAISSTDEVGGALYKQGSAYHYTLGVTAHASSEIDYRVALPQDAALVALYHTHPGTNAGADHFSPDDRDLADRMHTSMYVVVVKRHEVIGYHCKGFPLDVVPVQHLVLTVNGVDYIIHSQVDPRHWLVEGPDGHLLYYTTNGSEHPFVSNGKSM